MIQAKDSENAGSSPAQNTNLAKEVPINLFGKNTSGRILTQPAPILFFWGGFLSYINLLK
jgi:hypothetical protein